PPKRKRIRKVEGSGRSRKLDFGAAAMITTRCHSVRSLRCPDALSRQLSEVATARLTMREPSVVDRISGSRPRFPTKITRFIEPVSFLLSKSLCAFVLRSNRRLPVGETGVKASHRPASPEGDHPCPQQSETWGYRARCA